MFIAPRLFAVSITTLIFASQVHAGTDPIPDWTEQKHFIDRTAASIIACYEASGEILTTYDEEGRCSGDSELSAWTLSSTLPREVELTHFASLDSQVATVGEYEGSVTFQNTEGLLCSFSMNVSYSGEDILVFTDAFVCK